MPHVLVLFPSEDPFLTTYADVVIPLLRANNFSVETNDEVSDSSDSTADIAKAIERADLIVLDATELTPELYYRFGIATARDKETLVLSADSSDPLFNTRRWRTLFYSHDAHDAFGASLSAWVQRTATYRKHNPSANAPRLERGDIFPDIVDASIYLDATSEPVDDRIWRDIRRGSLLPCAYSYFTEVGAESWLKLCDDPLYPAFLDSLRMLATNASRIYEAIGSEFVNTSPDFVSLGPGNGQKDRVLLKELIHRLTTAGRQTDLFYYPIDISQRMIATAVSSLTRDPDLTHALRIKAAEGDFQNITAFRPIIDYRPAPNIFAFLGNTLGNTSDEISLLSRIKATMQPGDILLLEVRLAAESNELGGHESFQHGLSFAPLNRLGVPYSDDQMVIRHDSRLSQIPKTTTTSVHYVDASIRGHRIKDVALSCVNYYDRGAMHDTLSQSPLSFSILDVVQTDSMCLFVLKNP